MANNAKSFDPQKLIYVGLFETVYGETRFPHPITNTIALCRQMLVGTRILEFEKNCN